MALINLNQVKGGQRLVTDVAEKLDKSSVISEGSETASDDCVLSEKAVEEKIVQLKDNMIEHVEESVAVEDTVTEITLSKTPTDAPVKLLVNGVAYGEGQGITVDRASKKVTWAGEFPLNASTVDSMQLLYMTGDKGPVVIPLNATNVMGMVLVEEGNRVGTWARINENYETIDFDPSYGTWAGMKQVQDETYGEFTEIPITWVRTETLQSGPYAGCNCWWISDHEEASFHVHPAFIGQDGQPHNLQIASWIASKKNNLPFSEDKGIDVNGYYNTNYNTMHALNLPTGIQQYNIYDHHFLARMMLIEFGTPDVQSQTVDGVSWNGSNRISYHGIHDPFGTLDDKEGCLLDGLMTQNGTYQVIAADGSRRMIWTGVSCPDKGGRIVNCRVDQANGIDFGDMFIAHTTVPFEDLGSFADSQGFTAGNVYMVDWSTLDTLGAFCMRSINPISYSVGLGWRFTRCM